VDLHVAQKEEEKRKQRLEDWNRHLEGRGYRSKYRPPVWKLCVFYCHRAYNCSIDFLHYQHIFIIFWQREKCYVILMYNMDTTQTVVAGRGSREGSHPGWHFSGAAFHGENSEFWRLHCNMLAYIYIDIFLIYSVHWGWVLPIAATVFREPSCRHHHLEPHTTAVNWWLSGSY